MKKVNEVRWAIVSESGQLEATGWSWNMLENIIQQGQMKGRIARVRITEIEEGEDDKG